MHDSSNKTLQHAKSIERYSSEMLESGVGIAENTNEIKQLGKTLESAVKIVTLTESLKKFTEKILELLIMNAILITSTLLLYLLLF